MPERVNLNRASREEIEQAIEGMEASLANEIVKYRDANGRIVDVDDLRMMDGFNEVMIGKVREQADL